MAVKIERSCEEINSIGGISLIGGLFNSLNILKKVDSLRMNKVKTGKIKHSGILKTIAGLFALGKNDYADVTPFRDDAFFRDCLQLPAVASEATLRQRLDELARVQEVPRVIQFSNVEMLKKVPDFGVEKTAHSKYIPLDIDVSPLDNSGSKKEGVSWTYKKHDGYAPIFAYIGTHGYMLNSELRPGSQHSNKGALEFVLQCLDMAEQLGVDPKNVLVRLDSAHDDVEIIKQLLKCGVAFIIKRNLRKESKEQWLSLARRVGEFQKPRCGKTVYTGEASHIPVAGRENLPVFATFEVTERMIDKHGQELLIADIEVNTFWTNLPDDATTVINLYHAHGTSEQYHSEVKSDLGFERMPSGKFATNALLLLLAMLAFNALRILGQSALKMKEALPRKFKVQRRRLRSVLQDLIYIACKRTRHSGLIFLKFGRYCPWFEVFRQLHIKFC
ncbi:MAG: IS1380 family transposase [Planctomycetes bacterium]|nr:IS1380 family transposase [Lentisphaerota bacterium]MCP4607788.1 IS1380 family transposase [Planctomycetota bacterium]